jgi:peptide/nickel transport system permease protein
LLRDAQGFETLSLYPWLLLPGLMTIFLVLVFNFVSDVLRDGVDVRLN